MSRRLLVPGAAISALLLLAPPLTATTVLQMNLGELVQRADTIFRGTVLDVSEGIVHAGGADLPTVTYRLRVDESFRGEFTTVKGVELAEITMLGTFKRAPAPGSALRNLTAVPGLPRLERGHDYLLLVTRPSQVGLSVPVGLGQGAFRIATDLKQETATNDANNVGLFRGMAGPTTAPGPIPYDELAARIRALVQSIQ